jgi:hypothetical protein
MYHAGVHMTGNRRLVTILLWLAVAAGLAVSIASLIEELCMATACSDAASFVFFGIGMGVFGCIYFSSLMAMLFLRKRNNVLGWMFEAMIFSGVGAEFRLLWIQKYIIGSWCPLCVTICCSLMLSAVFLCVEKVQDKGERGGDVKGMTWWLLFAAVMAVAGFAVAFEGVQALS